MLLNYFAYVRKFTGIINKPRDINSKIVMSNFHFNPLITLFLSLIKRLEILIDSRTDWKGLCKNKYIITYNI